jgi:hypothetical protein
MTGLICRVDEWTNRRITQEVLGLNVSSCSWLASVGQMAREVQVVAALRRANVYVWILWLE